MVIWECEKCGHQAWAYDEIDHECENGEDYEAQGDECCAAIDFD